MEGAGRQLLFSVTAKDCRFDTFRGTGPGGQKRNKTSSGVRCTHILSGAWAESDETRDQHKNKRIAFRKMAETKEFKTWHKIETARHMGWYKEIEQNVERSMKLNNLIIEGKDKGKWVPIPDTLT